MTAYPLSLQVWFNNKGWASSVSYMNAANNLVLKSKLSKAGFTNYTRYGITAVNHPMNRTDYQLKLVSKLASVMIFCSLCVLESYLK